VDVRVAAVRALGHIRGADGTLCGIDHLLRLVERSKEADLLAEAVSALGSATDPRALPVLKPLIREAQPLVAVAAVEALARLTLQDRVGALLDGLAHSSPEVVKTTLRELSRTDDPRATSHIQACLDHAEWDVRRLAADLLSRLGGEANVQLLRTKLPQEGDPLVKEAIQRALEQMGVLHRTPIPGRGSYRP
jgi:HEAT repeat protein